MQRTKKYKGQVHAILALCCAYRNNYFCFIPILFIGLFKLFPNKRWQALCTRSVDAIAMVWCDINNLYIDKVQKLHWEITGLE